MGYRPYLVSGGCGPPPDNRRRYGTYCRFLSRSWYELKNGILGNPKVKKHMFIWLDINLPKTSKAGKVNSSRVWLGYEWSKFQSTKKICSEIQPTTESVFPCGLERLPTYLQILADVAQLTVWKYFIRYFIDSMHTAWVRPWKTVTTNGTGSHSDVTPDILRWVGLALMLPTAESSPARK